jgi:hypothetical protein
LTVISQNHGAEFGSGWRSSEHGINSASPNRTMQQALPDGNRIGVGGTDFDFP